MPKSSQNSELQGKSNEGLCSSENDRSNKDFTFYILNRVLQRVEKSISRKRRFPYLEEDSIRYDNYIRSIINFLEDKGNLIDDLYSGTYDRVLKAVKSFRILLSKKPPINEVIELGLLPKFVECLSSRESMLQYEAAWLITNVTYCSSVQTRFVIESGAVEALVNLLWTDCEVVQSQAAWALGNIAGDADEFRDYVISKGAIPGVVHAMKLIESEQMLLTCSWVLENICLGSSETGKLVQVLPILQTFLSHTNSELVGNCLKVLISITANDDLLKEAVYCGLLPCVIGLLYKGGENLHYALQVIVNLSNTDDNYVIQTLVQSKIFGHLSSLVQSSDVRCRRQASLIFNNITCNKSQIRYSITSGIFQVLLKILISEDDESIQKNIVGAIWNVMNNGRNEEIQYFLRCEVVKVLSQALTGPNDSIFHGVLCCLERVLEVGEANALANGRCNEIALKIEEFNGLESIEKLLSHESSDVYLKAYDLMEKYFSCKEERNAPTLEEVHSEYLSLYTSLSCA